MNDNESNGKQKLSITRKVVAKCFSSKRRLADYLNEKVNKLSELHKRISLIMFGILMGIICIAQFIRYEREEIDPSFSINKITLPKDIYINRNRAENAQIFQLKHFIDSLRNTKHGSLVVDSLLRSRPGMMDTVNLFIENYYSH